MAVAVIAIAAGIILWLQGFIYMKLWNKNLHVNISFSDKTAFEGASMTMTEELVNAKILPLPWLAIKFQVSRSLIFTDYVNYQISDDYYRNDLFSVLMYQKITRRLPFICTQRGYYRVKSVDLVGSNIMMGVKLVQSCSSDAAITVYPRLIDIDETAVPYNRMYGNILTRRFINPDPFTFKGIREYQPYDSMKSVNYNATAKTGKLMVNVNDYSLSQDIVIMLNLQPYSIWSSDALFEQSIRLAASLAAHYVGEGIPLQLISNGRDVASGRTTDLHSGSGASHLTNIYEALARIDLKQTTEQYVPMSTILYDKLYDLETDAVYILISTYHEADLQEAFDKLMETGADTLWIVPWTSDMDILMDLSENKVKWNAIA